MKARYDVRQEMSRYRLKDGVGFQVTYTFEDLQEAIKNNEISEKEYKEKSESFELK